MHEIINFHSRYLLESILQSTEHPNVDDLYYHAI